MKLPRGDIVRSRVVADPATPLADALDRSLTGYAVLEPQETVLLSGEGHGVLTFEDGVPVCAYHAGTDRGGPAALAALAQPGPYAAELYRLPPADLAAAHRVDQLQVAPGTPAERLAGDPGLADRTRAAAPAGREVGSDGGDPVVSFLEDDEKVAAIREQAREEAERRAAEWGLDDAVDGG